LDGHKNGARRAEGGPLGIGSFAGGQLRKKYWVTQYEMPTVGERSAALGALGGIDFVDRGWGWSAVGKSKK